MSRLIDADALHKAYMELRNFKQDPQSGDWISLRAVPLTTVIRMLNKAPTIDAVEVVRCQDCKHWVYNFNGCSRNPCTEPWYATDYCNYGERKESE